MAKWSGRESALKHATLNRALKAGDVIRTTDGNPHYIEYVNAAGAYAVPLTTMVREIKGTAINFIAGGRTISANSVAELINPLELGGNSPEYRAYVRLVSKAVGMARNKKGVAVPVGEFDSSDLPEGQEGLSGAVVGHFSDDAETAQVGEEQVAKKAKANGNGNGNGRAARAKTPKKARKCACGCGGDTQSYFQPGHDSKLHGFMRKLEKGEAEPKEYPYPSVVRHLDLQKTTKGYKAKNPHFYHDEA